MGERLRGGREGEVLAEPPSYISFHDGMRCSSGSLGGRERLSSRTALPIVASCSLSTLSRVRGHDPRNLLHDNGERQNPKTSQFQRLGPHSHPQSLQFYLFNLPHRGRGGGIQQTNIISKSSPNDLTSLLNPKSCTATPKPLFLAKTSSRHLPQRRPNFFTASRHGS